MRSCGRHPLARTSVCDGKLSWISLKCIWICHQGENKTKKFNPKTSFVVEKWYVACHMIPDEHSSKYSFAMFADIVFGNGFCFSFCWSLQSNTIFRVSDRKKGWLKTTQKQTHFVFGKTTNKYYGGNITVSYYWFYNFPNQFIWFSVWICIACFLHHMFILFFCIVE